MSEAQDISIESIPYDDLESVSRYPTIQPQPQPIILGFSLPPYYFSCTASTNVVVNVFCQLVSFIYETEAWDEYITKSTPVYDPSPFPSSIYRTFRELERSWTRDEGVNRDLLRNHGPSMCADLVKVSVLPFHTLRIHSNTHLDFIGILS